VKALASELPDVKELGRTGAGSGGGNVPTSKHWMDLYTAVGPDRHADEQTLRRIAYAACDGDSLALMTNMLRTIRDLAEQLGEFYGTPTEQVLAMEADLLTRA
jgi:predicted YcjX-like family ATPase